LISHNPQIFSWNETPRRRDSGVSSGKNYYLKNPPTPLLQKGVQGIPTAETVGYKNLIKRQFLMTRMPKIAKLCNYVCFIEVFLLKGRRRWNQ